MSEQLQYEQGVCKMKKLLLALIPLCVICVSNDVYVRQDVFSARMDAFMSEIRLMNQELRSEMKELQSEIKQDIQSVNARIDVTNARLDDLYTTVYWGFAIIGIFVALIAFAPMLMTMYQNLRKPSITL